MDLSRLQEHDACTGQMAAEAVVFTRRTEQWPLYDITDRDTQSDDLEFSSSGFGFLLHIASYHF